MSLGKHGGVASPGPVVDPFGELPVVGFGSDSLRKRAASPRSYTQGLQETVPASSGSALDSSGGHVQPGLAQTGLVPTMCITDRTDQFHHASMPGLLAHMP
jgi:hypothetical protein